MTSGLGAKTTLAVGGYLLTALTNVTAPLFAAVALYATMGLLKTKASTQPSQSPIFGTLVLAALVVGGLLVEYHELPFVDSLSTTLWLVCVAAAIAVPHWSAKRSDKRLLHWLLALVVVSTLVIGVRLMVTGQSVIAVSDVYAFHESAAAEVRLGRNPYVTARVLNTDPGVPPGTITTGYPYPPTSMAPLVASSAFLGDSRWILLASWVAMITVLGMKALALGGELLQPLLLLALFPAFRITLFVGWTELLILGAASLLVLGGRNHGKASAWETTVIGAMAASKQYMVFLAPLFLLVRSLRIPVSISALGLTAATLFPYLLLDPGAAYHALYENLATIGQRPDSFSISGMLETLGVTTGALPRVPWIALVLVVGVGLSRKIQTVSDFILVATLVLGIAFLTGIAFVNYWLLCAGLVLVGTMLKTEAAFPR